jgi:hypothetical protein
LRRQNNSATRSTNTHNSIIDIVCLGSSLWSTNLRTECMLPEITDHNIITVTVTIKYANCSTSSEELTVTQPQLTRQFNSKTMFKLASLLASTEWRSIHSDDLDEAWNNFVSDWNECIDSACPLKIAKSRTYRMPLPRELLHLIRMKRQLYHKCRRNPTNLILQQLYIQSRNSTNRTIRAYKLNTIMLEFEQTVTGSSMWWKIAKRHFVGDLNTLRHPNIIESENRVVTQPMEIAGTFAEHFALMYKSVGVEINNTNIETPLLNNVRSVDPFFSAAHIRLMIDRLQVRKSNLDKIPVHVFKYVSLFIAYPLSVLIQRTFQCSKVPRCLKVCRVIPLHKTGPRQVVANYRPISVQSVFATLVEKVAIQIADTYTAENHIISDNQFGFKLHHSCTHACLFHLSAIYRYIDVGMKVGCVYVDIRNAFPSVDHQILIQTLHKYNNLGLPNGWFESYLADRKMFVDI